jgi:hypothetical protein
MRVAGHLMIVSKHTYGSSWHLAERSDTSISKCGIKGTVPTPCGPWIPGFGACGRCRRIVGAEGYTHVVDSLDGSTTEL